MREIKFRAWDKTQKEMIPDVFMWSSGQDIMVWYTTFYELKMFTDGDWPDHWSRNEDCFFGVGEFDIMQYTGLKDKNGVEIYEGDIVSFNMYDDGEFIKSQEICWDEDRDFLGWNIKPGDENIEIIGNIHETR